MKKEWIKRAALLMLCVLIGCFFAACSGGKETQAPADNGSRSEAEQSTQKTAPDGTDTPGTDAPAKVTVTYDLNYESAPDGEQLAVGAGDVAEETDAPVREQYQFTGWYADRDCTVRFDFEEALYEDTTLFAGWKQTHVNVVFDEHYEGGAQSAVSVEIGQTVSQPANPVRGGYLFTAWYRDEAQTEAYDFSAPVDGPFTVYAGWEEESGDTVRLTYYWNYENAPDGGIASIVMINTNSKTKAYSVTREGYYMAGWYTDPECTEAFDFSKRIKSSVSLYARWYDIYTFEAEYVDFTGMVGNGYSGNVSGVGLIVKQKADNQQASNGHYVGWMYKPGNTLTFNIRSDRDAENAVIVLRLSAEFYDMTYTSSTLLVQVNGENLKYDNIRITDVPAQGSNAYKTFADFTISTKVSLKEGENVVKLVVNNEDRLGESGTMYATAPMFDCIYIYTDAALSWEPIEDNLLGNIS